MLSYELKSLIYVSQASQTRTRAAGVPNGFRDRAISLYSCKIIDKKEILRTVSNTYLLMYGAEPFLRSYQLCSHSENSQQL
jgi:hypothetical protein